MAEVDVAWLSVAAVDVFGGGGKACGRKWDAVTGAVSDSSSARQASHSGEGAVMGA